VWINLPIIFKIAVFLWDEYPAIGALAKSQRELDSDSAKKKISSKKKARSKPIQ